SDMHISTRNVILVLIFASFFICTDTSIYYFRIELIVAQALGRTLHCAQRDNEDSYARTISSETPRPPCTRISHFKFLKR
ncbi:MAG: hypothetical protein LLG42_05510, partial [Chloroflexi bacterium]|nr:hypothetical protein [Chloroflexota bacterium]